MKDYENINEKCLWLETNGFQLGTILQMLQKLKIIAQNCSDVITRKVLIETYFPDSSVCPIYTLQPKYFLAYESFHQRDDILQTTHNKTHNHMKRYRISVSKIEWTKCTLNTMVECHFPKQNQNYREWVLKQSINHALLIPKQV